MNEDYDKREVEPATHDSAMNVENSNCVVGCAIESATSDSAANAENSEPEVESANLDNTANAENCNTETDKATDVKCAIIVQFLQWSLHIRRRFELFIYIRDGEGKKIDEKRATRSDLSVVFDGLSFGVYEVFAESRYNIHKIGAVSLNGTNNVANLEFIY